MISVAQLLWFLYGGLLSSFLAFVLSHYRSVSLRTLVFICSGTFTALFIVLGTWPDDRRIALLGSVGWMFSARVPLSVAWKPLIAAYGLFGLFLLYFIPRYEAIGLGPQQGTIRRVLFPFRAVAITFDDGPSPEWTPRVLQVLKKHQVQATFFMVGEAVEKYPELVTEVARAGHSIGSHSYSHQCMPLLDRGSIEQELDRTESALERVLGRKPQLFRPPWGMFNKCVLDAARQRGYLTVLWSRSGQDWRRPGVDAIVHHAASNPKLGDIVLLHDGGDYPGHKNHSREQTVEALDKMIVSWENAGFQIKTIDEMVRAWLS